MRHPTGLSLLDRLLQGGLPPKSQTLLYGPSFIGKDVLARTVLLSNLENGVPAIVVLTNTTASEAKDALASVEPKFEEYQRQGLVWFVDAYSRSVDAEQEAPNVVYTDAPADLNGLAVALNEIQTKIVPKHDQHFILLDSVSTLVLYSNAPTTFRFLQILLGKARRAGAATLLLMDEGMHEDSEVQMFRHLCDGALSLRTKEGNTQFLLEGLGVSENPGWLDYRFTPTRFQITGSLAGGRIR